MRNLSKHFLIWSNRLISAILYPFKMEWPFIVVMTILGNMMASYMMLRAVIYPHTWIICFLCFAASFFIAYCLSCTFLWLHGTWRWVVKIFLYIVGIVLCMTDFIGAKVFGVPISVRMYILFVETTGEEISGFFQTFGRQIFAYSAILLGLWGGICFCLERYKKTIQTWFSAWMKRIVFVGVYVLLIFGSVQALSPVTILLCRDVTLEKWLWKQAANGRLEFMNVWHKSLTTAGYVSIMGREFADWQKYNRQVLAAPARLLAPQDTISIYFVIGESYIRSHSQIYGYGLETTPTQLREFENGNLIPFKDIWSTSRTTSPSVKNMLNLSSISQGETLANGAFFPLILKNAGYEIKIFDHQKVDGTFCDASLLSFLYNNLLIQNCYSYVATPGSCKYDNDFLENESKHLYDDVLRKFYIVHLGGQHFPFDKNLPADKRFHRFDKNDYLSKKCQWMNDAKRKDIANYDNVTFYNDYVIGEMIGRLKKRKAIVVYFSDHGEEVYDYRDNMGRTAPPEEKSMNEYMESLYHVPFWIWISPELKESRNELYNLVMKAADRFGTTDDVGHAMLHLAGVESPYYKSSRDILSDDYAAPSSLKTEEGYAIRRK